MLREEAFVDRLVEIAGEENREAIEDFVFEQLHKVFEAEAFDEDSDLWD